MGMERAAGAVAVIIALTFLSKALGLAREMVMAAFYGAGAVTDAYLTATLIFMLIFNLLGGRALGAALIPVYSFLDAAGERERADKLAGTVMSLAFSAFLMAALLGSLLAPSLVGTVAPGLPNQTREQAAGFTRLLLSGLPVLASGSLLAALLHLRGIFSVPAASGIFLNLSIIGFILLSGGNPATGLVAGTLCGYLTQVLVAGAALLQKKNGVFTAPDFREPGLARVGRLLWPVLAGAGVTQLSPLVNRIVASLLPEGSISALSYADRVVQVPLELLVTAAVTVSYPALAGAAAGKRDGEMGRLLDSWAGLLVFVTLPLALLLAGLGYPLVQALFERGAFDSTATGATAAALFFYSLGLPFVAVNRFLTRVFYAFQDSRTPMLVGLGTAAVNIFFCLALTKPMGHCGLALASSLAAASGVPLLLFLLKPKTGFALGWRTWKKKLFYAAASLAVSALTMLAVSAAVGGTVRSRPLGSLFYLSLVGGTGLLSYYLAARHFKMEEAALLAALLKKFKLLKGWI